MLDAKKVHVNGDILLNSKGEFECGCCGASLTLSEQEYRRELERFNENVDEIIQSLDEMFDTRIKMGIKMFKDIMIDDDKKKSKIKKPKLYKINIKM
jgi:transcription elongation factor Elf1